MNIYIKATNNFPDYDWGVSALTGFRLKGTNVNFFDDINQVPLNRYSMVVSYIEDTKKFFDGMGWKVNYDLSLPNELHKEKYLKRNVKKISHKPLEQTISNQFMNLPFFMKPNNVKEFTPTIIKTFNELINYNDFNDFIVSEVVDFVSEYRCYIIDRKIVGCYNYLGDIYKYPNLKLVDEMIKDFKSAPMGYSIDVGILPNGETALVECNDGWSLGNYGLSPKLYTRLLVERWIEILKQNPIK